MDLNTFNEEKEHLKSIVDRLEVAKDTLDRSMMVMGEENLKVLRDLRENPETNGADFFFFLEQLHEKNQAFNFKDKYKKLDELETLKDEPFFARIDIKEPNTTSTAEQETFYIGKFGFTLDKPIITDWRAKVASIYYRYRYPQKNVSFDTPDGKEVKDLTLKRTFEIDKGSLIKYYNNDIQLDEKDIIVGKIEKRTGGVLEDIVETIQESQLDIIESEPRQICIVQGCVGSGKSTVAIHKLSHIFFNYVNFIHPERSILVAKNQILVGYLSTLFPKLGIFDINYKSLRDLIYNLVFREELHFDIDFDKGQDAAEVNIHKIRHIYAFIEKIHNDYKEELENIFANEEFESFGGNKYNPKAPVVENIEDIILDLEEELNSEAEVLKEDPNSARAWLYKENIKTLKKLLNVLKKLRLKLKETTLLGLAKQLNIPVNGKMGYTDTLLYLFIYSELVGFSKTIKYEYCVVDEGQDFSVLEYLVLGKVVLNGRFCILGDLNQSYNERGLSTWDEISEVIKDAKNANTFELDTNYRSTKPIIDLANNILSPYTKKYLPKSINRKGSEPVFEKATSISDLMEQFKHNIKAEIKKMDKSIGVICMSTESFNLAKTLLDDLKIEKDKYVVLNEKEKISYIPKGIYLTSFDNCKGLEFAKVYVLDLDLDTLDSFTKAKKAFVAVTRAMNDLSIYSVVPEKANNEENI